jgi:hypothetical protein
MWFQFGSIENIYTWMRITSTAGYLIPIGLIFFFFAFTGYDKRMDAKVLGIKVRHFKISIVLLIFVFMLLVLFTDLLFNLSETPEYIWDTEFGPVGNLMFLLFAVIFFYLFVMVFKSYRLTENKPQKRFILLLSAGTLAWILSGYVGAILFSPSSEVYSLINYL